DLAHPKHRLVHRLQAEIREFRQQDGYWKSRRRDNMKRINALERRIEPIPMIAGCPNLYFSLPHARSVLPCSPQGVGGEEGVGGHIWGHLERLVVDRLALGRGTAGNLAEQLFRK